MRLIRNRLIYFIFLTFIATACKNRGNNDDSMGNKTIESIKSDSTFTSDFKNEKRYNEFDNLISKFSLAKINLDSIKLIYRKSSTSGMLSKEEYNNFKNIKDQIFGFYYFIDSSKKLKTEPPYSSRAVVKVDDKFNWKYSAKDEELVEYRFYSNTLNPYKKLIKIGYSKDSIIDLLGNDYGDKDNYLEYVTEDHIVSIFLKDKTVTSVRVRIN